MGSEFVPASFFLSILIGIAAKTITGSLDVMTTTPYTHLTDSTQSKTINGSRDLIVDRNSSAGINTSLESINESVENVSSAVVQPIAGEATPPNATSPTPPSTTTLTTILVKSIEDHHKYYKSQVMTSEETFKYWIDERIMHKAAKHQTLSESYRSAATISLSFPFTFYGHEVNQVTIATGGFLYMSEFLHQWLTVTQYIAPLMANFDTQIGNNSHIRYFDNGTVFVVWWEDVHLQDDYGAGQFNFQVMLHRNSSIIFSYKEIPTMALSKIPSHRHPVKVGLSDAYYMDKATSSDMKQRTIYEYHRVEINMSLISNNTSVIITHLPSCIQAKTCLECIQASKNVDMTCQWCPVLQHCSDGLDRKRQEWLHYGCDKEFLSTEDQCKSYGLWRYSASHLVSFNLVCAAVVVALVVVVMSFVLAWFVYAYRNPSSRSGIWLIEHHPSTLITRVQNFFARLRHSINASKYRVAMQPEAESLAQM